jgi:putative nucleotidyltransferase with HDIG domain
MNLDSAIKSSMTKLPAFPATVHRVTSLINNPDSSMTELVDVIRLDQAITANILRMCNSAYFGLRHKVDNVQDAIMYLGRQNIVRAVLAAGTSRFFKNTPGYEAEAKDLWEHAVGTALLAQILARKILRREDSSLFTAAILHDIGKIVLGEFVRDKYAEIKKIVSEQSRSFLEAEEKVLGMNHATLGGMIAANWKFPEDIRNAIAFHHRPDRLPSKTEPMPWIVHLADQGCIMLGIGRGADGLAYEGLDGAMNRLGLSQQDFEEALAQLVREMDTARDMVGIVQSTAN